MRIKRLKGGLDLRRQLRLVLMRLGGYAPTDLTRTLMYRPEFFGDEFAKLQIELARGTSEWTLAERELFCAFVSTTNGCRF